MCRLLFMIYLLFEDPFTCFNYFSLCTDGSPTAHCAGAWVAKTCYWGCGALSVYHSGDVFLTLICLINFYHSL